MANEKKEEGGEWKERGGWRMKIKKKVVNGKEGEGGEYKERCTW